MTAVNALNELPAAYVGQWAANVPDLSHVNNRESMRHGCGNCIWNDGSIYEGYWLYDKMQGVGRCIYKDGSYYEG